MDYDERTTPETAHAASSTSTGEPRLPQSEDPRFRVPAIRFPALLRERLFGRSLDPLTLVGAPAGYGKTVAVAARLATAGAARGRVGAAEAGDGAERALWMRSGDTSPERFWAHLAAALRVQTNPDPRRAEEARAFCEARIAALEQSTVVVIDDYHLLTSRELDLALAALCSLSELLHLVVIARRFAALDGPLMLSSVQPRLVTARELAFTDAEVRELAQQSGLTVNGEMIETAVGSLAGWPSPIQAVFAGRRERERSAAGAQRLLGAFARTEPETMRVELAAIANEYLNLLDSVQAQRALLVTALCPNAGIGFIADALLESDTRYRYSYSGHRSQRHAIEIMRDLQGLGLIEMVWAPDTSRFRCHPGLQQFLLGRAFRELGSDERRALRLRHADDLAPDDPVEALKLYCELGDLAAAERLVSRRFAELFDADSGAAEPVRAVCDERLTDYPLLAGTKLLLSLADPLISDQVIAARLDLLRATAERRAEVGESGPGLGDLSMLVLAERLKGKGERSLTLALELERRLLERPAMDPGVSRAAVPMLHSVIGFTGVVNGDLALGRRSYLRSLECAERIGSVTGRIRALYGLAFCAANAGEDLTALQYGKRAGELEAEWPEHLPRLSHPEATTVRAMTAAASGDAEGVRSALGEVEEVFGRTESWPLHVIAEAQSMRRHLGDYQALLVIRRQLLNRPSVTPASAYLRRRLALFTADLTMFLGDLASAERQLARFSTELPEVAVSRARLQLLRGRVEEAQRTLETIRVPSGLQRVLLERELLGAIAAWQAGERDEAMFALDASLSRMVSTCGWGVLATVPYEPVLELAAAAAGRPGGRDLLQQLRELPETLRCLQIEQLTGAELRTLLTLAEGGSLEQTAGALFVSLNTVKFHLRRIYRKLRVSGREEAIRRAKRMGLIPSKASARQGGAENGVRGGPGGGKPVNTLG